MASDSEFYEHAASLAVFISGLGMLRKAIAAALQSDEQTDSEVQFVRLHRHDAKGDRAPPGQRR